MPLKTMSCIPLPRIRKLRFRKKRKGKKPPAYDPASLPHPDKMLVTATGKDGRPGFDVTYKILLLGDSAVGKTSLIQSLKGKDFKQTQLPTVGIDFVKETFEVDGARIQLQIWDTAGQERFRTITKFQYRGTKGLLLVYDITNRDSFNMMEYWLDSIDKEIDADSKEPIPVFVLANKSDLTDDRKVIESEGKRLADTNYVAGFLETSAVTGHNVRPGFWRLAKALAEVNHPKLMNAYLTPFEKQEKHWQMIQKPAADLARTQTIKLKKQSEKKRKHHVMCSCIS